MYSVIAGISGASHSRSTRWDGSMTIISMPFVAVLWPCRSGPIVLLPHKVPASSTLPPAPVATPRQIW
jgi:hypothetical protein